MSYQYNSLKVAFIHPRLEGGGSERVSITTARRFSLWGIHSTFIGSTQNKREFSLTKDINGTIHLLPDSTTLYTEVNAQAIINLIKSQDIRIVFTCYVEGDFMRPIIDNCRTNCRFVFWNHTNPFWEQQYKVESGEMGAKYSIKRWIQWHLLGGKHKATSTASVQSIKDNYIRDLNLYDRYIVLSPTFKRELVEALQLPPEQEQKITPFINTIDVNETPILTKNKTIIFVGRMSLVQKRFDRMLRIWRRVQDKLPDWELKFYGAGPDEWIFHKLVDRYKLKRVSLEGYRTNPSEIYDTASILCVTSTFEGWSMVLAEGQNNGIVPILYNSYSSARDIVGVDSSSGILVSPFNETEFASKLIHLCSDNKLLKELQSSCLRKRHDYSLEVNDDQWHQFITDLIK